MMLHYPVPYLLSPKVVRFVDTLLYSFEHVHHCIPYPPCLPQDILVYERVCFPIMSTIRRTMFVPNIL